jgi:hypothetical protein
MFASALRNVLMSALLVVGATAATTGVTCLAVIIVGSADSGDYTLLMHGGVSLSIMAAGAGIVFSFVTLVVAVLTMPPTLLVAHMLKLPRPTVDMVGGGVAGVMCAGLALSGIASFASSKGGPAPDDTATLLLAACGFLGGIVLGYWRHAVLVRKPMQLLDGAAAA